MDSRPFLVVGVDGSEMSSLALAWAAGYARQIGAEVRVVTAYDVPWTIFVAPTYTEADYARDAAEMLERSLSAAFPGGTDVPLQATVMTDRPARALTDAAHGAAVLVVGSQGHGELPGMHLGSVANYCVHHAPCPVVVYRRPQE